MYSSYLNLKNGQNVEASVEVLSVGQVRAVFIKGQADLPLDADFGAGIDIDLQNVESFMADYRRCEYWCMPQFGRDLREVLDETQGLICKKTDGSYAVILPVVSEQYKCVLKGNARGGVTARLFSWYDQLCSCNCLALMYAEGDDPYKLLRSCAKTALELLGSDCKLREQRQYPEMFEYLGWCSWDAMEIRVCEEDLFTKCAEFRDKQIPVRWAILDDMWEEVRDFYGKTYPTRTDMYYLMHASRLYSFQADPIRFPNGLKHCIEGMNEYGIRVGIWHPTTGYWAGIDPEGPIYRDHQDLLIRTRSDTEKFNNRYIVDYKTEKAYPYYKAIHGYLKESGAEFVKIDNQTMTRRYYKNLAPVGEVARSFHNAIEQSVREHFDNCMINCMGMGSEDMWNRSSSPVSRCSGDFQPENAEWFINHVLMCAYNDLIQGQFYYCDWDMWWTDDGQAKKNSLLRAISGGPIYLSDKIGRSIPEIIRPIVLEDGRILRCDNPATPTLDCLTEDPRTSGGLMKIQNLCTNAHGKNGVLAVFNLNQEGNVSKGSISPADVNGLEGESFAVYEHFSGELRMLGREERMELSLKDINDFRLYIIVPVVDGFAPIGRTDKFVSPKTVQAVHGREVILSEAGRYAVVKDGRLVIYESNKSSIQT